MSNAKEELMEEIGDGGVECAYIKLEESYEEYKDFILKRHYTNDDWNEFLGKLDFEYNEGYGGQELFGYVLLTDGTWLERGEYDGSEWWALKRRPDLSECN